MHIATWSHRQVSCALKETFIHARPSHGKRKTVGCSLETDSRSRKASNKRANNFWPHALLKVAPRRGGPMDARDIESDPCASSFSTSTFCVRKAPHLLLLPLVIFGSDYSSALADILVYIHVRGSQNSCLKKRPESALLFGGSPFSNHCSCRWVF